MKYLLNEEVKKMQHLAGITPSKSLFEKFIDGETEYKTLKEFMSSLNEETTQAAIDAAKEYLEKLEDQGQGNILAAGEKVANALSGIDNLTRDTLGAKINTFFKSKGDQIRKSIFGATMALVMLAHSLGPSIPVGSKTYTVKTKGNTELVQANNQLNQNLQPIVASDQDDLDQASNQNPEYDDTTTNTDLHIQHKTGESGISQQDNQQIDDYTDAITSAVLDDGMDIDLTVKSGDSNNGNKFSNVSKSGGKLDQERNDNVGDEVTDKLVKSFQKKGAKITKTEDGLKVEKNGKTHTVKITKKLINWQKNKVTSANDKNPTQSSELTAKATSADTEKVVKSFKFLDFVENPRLPGEIPVGKRGDDKPRPTGDDKEPGVERPIPTGDADPDEAKKLFKNKNLNRNQEIFSVLKMANPNIKGDPNDTTYKSWDPNTKKVVISLRKSPDTLLKKFQQVTGINLSQRQKSTGKFKRSGVAENISLGNMLNEAAIDQTLASIGVTDDAIRKNKVEVMAMLMAMYNLRYDDVDKSKLTPEEQKQLKDITVSEELEKQIQKQRPDVSVLEKDIESNSSLKTALSRINTYDEFEALVLGMAALVNPNFAKQKQDIRTALSSLASKVRAMKEESDTPSDTEGVYKIIETLKLLKNHLNNINNREEFEQLIFVLLKYIDPKGTITKDTSKLANAIIAASNASSLKDARPVDLDKLGI
jgi:hypothetical protein